MSIPSWAKVGTKVVCIHGTGLHQMKNLVDGTTYTIRAVTIREFDTVCLLLKEVRNKLHPTMRVEMAYHIKRFRPLVSTKTEAEDMAEHFDKLLIGDPIVRLDLLLEALDQ